MQLEKDIEQHILRILIKTMQNTRIPSTNNKINFLN